MRVLLLTLGLTACSDDFWGTDKDPGDDGKNPGDKDTAADDTGETEETGETGGTTATDDDGDGLSEDEGDCNDDDATVGPSEAETAYNGIDDDCDPATLDNDLDGDGYDKADDCDDSDAGINPNANELPYNGNDDDCDPRTPDDDVDGDGFTREDDCDDEAADSNPDASETTTDERDNDCDGAVDEAFEVGTIDTTGDAGNPSAIGIDSAGSVHIVYRDGDVGTLRYIRNDGSAWTAAEEIVSDSSVGESLDLVVDHSDELQIAYTWEGGGTTDLWFGWMDASGIWDTGYLIDGFTANGTTNTGHYVSIAVDSDNLPSFAYFDADYLVPVLADYTSFGVAVYTDIDILWAWTYATGYFTTLAIDSNDYDHVAWFDDNALGSEAQYSDFNEGTVNETIADDGWYTSLALKSDDSACVAYQDSTAANLVYGCRDAATGTWSATTLDSTGSVGAYAQLAFNSADEPWIAYYDESNGNLKVAAMVASAWVVSTVDSTGDVGIAPSIAIGADDQVIVSYYDATNAALKVAVANE